MRPPQRTGAPVTSLAAASRGVIGLNSPCSGCGAVTQAASIIVPRASRAIRRFIGVLQESFRLAIVAIAGRRAMRTQRLGQGAGRASPRLAVSVTPIAETVAEDPQLAGQFGPGSGNALHPATGGF